MDYDTDIHEFLPRKERKMQRYTGKGVRLKTRMIAHWKSQGKNTTMRNKKKMTKLQKGCKWKKKKTTPTRPNPSPVIPRSIRKKHKWNHPRRPKDTYQALMNPEVSNS